MKLLQQRSEEPGYRQMYSLDTGVFSVIMRDRHFRSVTLRNVDLFGYSLLVIPVHLNGNHWTLVVSITVFVKCHKMLSYLNGDTRHGNRLCEMGHGHTLHY